MTIPGKLPTNLNNRLRFCLLGSPEQTACWSARSLAQGIIPHHWNASDDHTRLDSLIRGYWPELLRTGIAADAKPSGYVIHDQLQQALDQVSLLLICDPDYRLDTALIESFPELLIAVEQNVALPGNVPAVRCLTQEPLHLLPLVELTGQNLSAVRIDRVCDFFQQLGMQPSVSAQSAPLSLRLQRALHQEMEQIEKEGQATRNELQNLLSMGPALNWSTGDLESPQRNACLIDLMKSQRHHQVGAGLGLADAERLRYQAQQYSQWRPGVKVEAPLRLYQGNVLPDWVDYNGHMSESFYLYAFGEASDALFRYIGIDEDYRASENSFYTVETHINYYREASNGDPLTYSTQILAVDKKRLHLFHSMFHAASGDLLCTTEQMLLHVDMAAATACAIQPPVLEALLAILETHQELPVPKQVGRVMTISP
ncbi:thioesterase family protein [Motiliproteus sp. MSK22-1]|uniref:thioesterase family protein n=1 Tax=Motiliproteus sp. MSK22-1 TaxID=1897630 RepID=UPI0018E93A12|nr:thioesterase family protein [Motiliproteus sp. MSK22-1]